MVTPIFDPRKTEYKNPFGAGQVGSRVRFCLRVPQAMGLLSAAMLLRYSLNCAAEADAIEAAVDRVLQAGWRTADIAGSGTAPLSCTEMTEKILAEL